MKKSTKLKKNIVAILCIGLLTSMISCGEEESPSPTTAELPNSSIRIQSAKIASTTTSHQYMGDLWTSTWADDGRLVFSFGDGTGMKNCAPSPDGENVGTFSPIPAEKTEEGCFNIKKDEVEGALGKLFCAMNGCSSCLKLCPFTPHSSL